MKSVRYRARRRSSQVGRAGLLLCLLAGSAARADELPIDVKVSAEDRLALEQILVKARGDELPTSLLIDKIREGVAKRVPAVRLIAVVRGVGDALRETSTLVTSELGPVGPEQRAVLARSLLDARAAAISNQDVREVLRAAKTPAVASSALFALSDLVARGFPAGEAAHAVAVVAASRPAALDRLAGEVERARGLGASTGEALDATARNAARGDNLISAGRQNGANGKASANDDPSQGSSAARAPDRETTGARGRSAGKGTGKGKP